MAQKKSIKFNELYGAEELPALDPVTPSRQKIIQIGKDIYSNLSIALRNEIAKAKPENLLKPFKSAPSGSQSTILFCTDVHLGKYVRLEDKLIYDTETTLNRLKVFFAEGLNHAIKNKSDELTIVLGGDMVEGEGLIYKTQAWHVDSVLIDQIRSLTTAFWNILAALTEHYRINVYCIRGNHGGSGGSEITNWDSVFYDYLKLAAVVTKNKKIAIITSDDEFLNFQVKNHKFHLRHKIVRNSDTPGGRGTILSHARNHKADVILTGHWHNFKYTDINHVDVIYGGSVVGGDSYSDTLSLASKACQLIIDVSDQYPIASLKPVFLK